MSKLTDSKEWKALETHAEVAKTWHMKNLFANDAARAERRVTTLMGDKVEPRRKWIESHVKFGLEEEVNILDNENMIISGEEV